MFRLYGKEFVPPWALVPSWRAASCLVTHIFVDDDVYLDSDAVFATKASLLGDFKESDDAELARRFGLPTPFAHLAFDFGLMKEAPANSSLDMRLVHDEPDAQWSLSDMLKQHGLAVQVTTEGQHVTV